YTCASLTSTSPAPPCVSTLSLHDALPISRRELPMHCRNRGSGVCSAAGGVRNRAVPHSQRRGASGDHGAVCVSGAWGLLASHERSEEHTSELQSRGHLVCRLLLEKKNIKI